MAQDERQCAHIQCQRSCCFPFSFLLLTANPKELTLEKQDQSNNTVAEMELMYNNEPTGLFLHDDGLHGDFLADDGVFGFIQSIPPRNLNPGMLNLGVRGTDIEGNQSPTYPLLAISE